MTTFRLIAAAAAACLAGLGAATAAGNGYVDDRSTPRAVIKSLYNAIGTHQYARAWSYFEEPPAADLDTYAAGFADTRSVNVQIGAPIEDNAAGNTYWQVPVALSSVAGNGKETVFAGCYTLHLANPEVQGTPFAPIAISGSAIKVSDQPFYSALPSTCGGMAADPVAVIREQAEAQFAADFSHRCRALSEPNNYPPPEPDVHELRFTPDYDGATEQLRYVIRFWCDMGAYNEMHAYYMWDDNDGMKLLQFASPELDIRYENDDFEGKVEEIRIIGFHADDLLVNSDYDPEIKSVFSFSKWRGLGDASASGTWLFRQGEFTLVRYDVDASYDEDINPETVLDYESAP